MKQSWGIFLYKNWRCIFCKPFWVYIGYNGIALHFKFLAYIWIFLILGYHFVCMPSFLSTREWYIGALKINAIHARDVHSYMEAFWLLSLLSSILGCNPYFCRSTLKVRSSSMDVLTCVMNMVASNPSVDFVIFYTSQIQEKPRSAFDVGFLLGCEYWFCLTPHINGHDIIASVGLVSSFLNTIQVSITRMSQLWLPIRYVYVTVFFLVFDTIQVNIPCKNIYTQR